MSTPPQNSEPHGLSQPRGGWRKRDGSPGEDISSTPTIPPIDAAQPSPSTVEYPTPRVSSSSPRGVQVGASAAYSRTPNRPAPARHLLLSILGLLLCLPVGLYACYRSLQVHPAWDEGDDVSANTSARQALTAGLTACIIGLAMISLALGMSLA